MIYGNFVFLGETAKQLKHYDVRLIRNFVLLLFILPPLSYIKYHSHNKYKMLKINKIK